MANNDKQNFEVFRDEVPAAGQTPAHTNIALSLSSLEEAGRIARVNQRMFDEKPRRRETIDRINKDFGPGSARKIFKAISDDGDADPYPKSAGEKRRILLRAAYGQMREQIQRDHMERMAREEYPAVPPAASQNHANQKLDLGEMIKFLPAGERAHIKSTVLGIDSAAAMAAEGMDGVDEGHMLSNRRIEPKMQKILQQQVGTNGVGNGGVWSAALSARDNLAHIFGR